MLKLTPANVWRVLAIAHALSANQEAHTDICLYLFIYLYVLLNVHNKFVNKFDQGCGI